MGRGRSGAGGGVKIKGLADAISFDEFISANIDIPEFDAIGASGDMDTIRDLWYETRTKAELKDIHAISVDDAVDQVRGSISESTLDGWFRNADSDYKPKLVQQIMSHPGTLNAGLNIAYQNYIDSGVSNPMPFEKWVRTPQTMYRGDYGQSAVKSDLFMSFTPNKAEALKFGSHVTTIRIRPIDTWGSYQTTGEQEFLIPVKRLRRK